MNSNVILDCVNRSIVSKTCELLFLFHSAMIRLVSEDHTKKDFDELGRESRKQQQTYSEI